MNNEAPEFITRCVCGIPSRTGLCEHPERRVDPPAAPTERDWHPFLQYPLGRFRKPEDDIGKCWFVINLHYCGLPADAAIHQAPTSSAVCIHCGRSGDDNPDYCGKQRGLQKCVFPSAVAPAAPDERDKALVEAVAEPWICVEDKPCEETTPVHWEELVAALEGMLATVRVEVWRDAIAVAKSYMGGCPGHVQMQMQAALESARTGKVEG